MPPQTKKIQKNIKTSKIKNKEYLCLNGLKVKEDGEEITVTGLIATTHPDRDNEMLSTNTLHQMTEAINNTSSVGDNTSNGAVRSVSLYHDWVKKQDPTLDEAAFLKPTARVVDLEDGHTGVEVDAVINKYYRGDGIDSDEVKYRIENGAIGGFSIEYLYDSEDATTVNYDGKEYTFVDKLSNFSGVGFARARMIANPSAVIYKEIEKEVNKMAEEESKPTEEQPKAEEPKEEVKVEEKTEEAEEKKEEEPKEEETKEEPEAKETKEISLKEAMRVIKESHKLKEAIDAQKIEKKVVKTKEDESPMQIKVKEINKQIDEGDLIKVKEMIQEHGWHTMAIEEALQNPMMSVPALKDSLDNGQAHMGLKVKCSGKGLKIVGGLKIKATLDSTSNTSSYTQAPVEFDDIFAPGIIDTFNNQTNFFGYLRKEAHPGGTHYQWRMVTDKDPESNDTFVDFDDVSVAKNFASKGKYQTPIKIARRGISVADTTLRYSSRSLGDEFQLEVDLQMKELMNDVDKALFAEVQDGADARPLGLEAVADGAGNPTVYGLTRSTANRLLPDTATDTYTAVGGSVVEADFRAFGTKLETAGTIKSDIAMIANPISRDYLFNLQDTNIRFSSDMKTAKAMFGFSQLTVPEFDGYPIIADHNCNSDAVYWIDSATDVIVIAMEPRVVNLARVGAATEAYIEFHFAHVYKEPRKIYMADTLNGPTT